MSVSRGLGAAAPGLGSPAKSPGGEGQKPHIFSRASWRPPMEPHHIPTHSKEPVTARGADSCSDQEAVCRPAATGMSQGGSAPVPSPGKAHPIESQRHRCSPWAGKGQPLALLACSPPARSSSHLPYQRGQKGAGKKPEHFPARDFSEKQEPGEQRLSLHPTAVWKEPYSLRVFLAFFIIKTVVTCLENRGLLTTTQPSPAHRG